MSKVASKKAAHQIVLDALHKIDRRNAKRTTLNPDALSIDQRMPDIADRLLVVEELLERCPDGAPDEWPDFCRGLLLIIRDARLIADDCFEQAQDDEDEDDRAEHP